MSQGLSYPRLVTCSISCALDSRDLAPIVLSPSTKSIIPSLLSPPNPPPPTIQFGLDEMILQKMNSLEAESERNKTERTLRIQKREAALEKAMQDKLLEEAKEAEEKERLRREQEKREAEAKAKLEAEHKKLMELKEAFEKQQAALMVLQGKSVVVAQPVNPLPSPSSMSSVPSGQSQSQAGGVDTRLLQSNVRQFKELSGVTNDAKATELLKALDNDLNHAVTLFFSDEPNIDHALEKAKLLKSADSKRAGSPAPVTVAQTHPSIPVKVTFILPNSGHLQNEFKSDDTFWTLIEYLCAQHPEVGQKPFKLYHIASATTYSDNVYDNTLDQAKFGSAAMLKVIQT